MSETANPPDGPIADAGLAAAPQAAPRAELTPDPGPHVPANVPDEFDAGPPRYQRRVMLPLALFLATCATTFAAGVYGWEPMYPDETLLDKIHHSWPRGLEYMIAVIAVLLAHEMGHFLMTVRYRIPASYPIFIPMPIMMMTGTMGAVISMDGLRADRRQLFDIGIAGPLAGLVLTIPFVCIGLKTAEQVKGPTPPGLAIMANDIGQPNGIHYGEPLLIKLVLPYLRPDLPENAEIRLNPLLMAGWVGLLITGLNMMPVSQLDGGHIIYGLLGRRGRWVARAFLFAAIAFVVIGEHYSWLVMIVLVIFLGADHPPTSNDRARIGPLRWLIGIASLAIPILCFTPSPFSPD
jgi:membrane-associated protease RseP (regulator of RpoE activity)